MKRTCSAILVSYTDSSSENEEDQTKPSAEVSSSPPPSPPPPPKKRKLPPLPAHLAPSGPLDDPSKHQGRTRATPHVDGQWAAHVYVSIVLRGALRDIVSRAVTIAKGEVASVRVVGDSSPEDSLADSVAGLRELHISLTRPFFLRAHQREAMKRVVRDAAKAHPP
jgi:U6 snRNA phosphodiesterase